MFLLHSPAPDSPVYAMSCGAAGEEWSWERPCRSRGPQSISGSPCVRRVPLSLSEALPQQHLPTQEQTPPAAPILLAHQAESCCSLELEGSFQPGTSRVIVWTQASV